MHWIDPDQLPTLHGTINQFLVSPDGEVDGLILDDGTEVRFPPHLSDAVRALLPHGASIMVRGLRSRHAPVWAAVALGNAATGQVVADDGPDDAKRNPTPRKSLVASGTVARRLHGPKGDVRGVLLENGTILRLRKHALSHVANLLQPGRHVVARGEGVDTPLGRCIAVTDIGPSVEALRDVRKPLKPADHADELPPGAAADAAGGALRG